MRDTITLSFPADLLKELRKAAKKAGISVSGYVQKMFSFQHDLISEEELLEDLRSARKDRAKGNVKELHHVDELDLLW